MNFVSGSSSNQQVARYTKKQTRGIFYPSPACEKLPVNSPFSFAQQRGTKASMLVSRNARRFQNLTALSPICFHRAAGRNGTASQFYKAAPFSSIPPSRFDASLNLYLTRIRHFPTAKRPIYFGNRFANSTKLLALV